MVKQRFHLNTSHLVSPCDMSSQHSEDNAISQQLCHSIAQLEPMERDLIRRMVENLQLLAQSAPKSSACMEPKHDSIPLVSIGPSGLHGRFQAEY